MLKSKIQKLYTRQCLERIENLLCFLNTFITEKDSASDCSQNYLIDLALYESNITSEISDANLETRLASAIIIAGYAGNYPYKSYQIVPNCIHFRFKES